MALFNEKERDNSTKDVQNTGIHTTGVNKFGTDGVVDHHQEAREPVLLLPRYHGNLWATDGNKDNVLSPMRGEVDFSV